METIKQYFEHISSLQRTLILVGGLMIFYAIEFVIPYIKLNYEKRKIQHAGINLFFTFTTGLVNFFLAFMIVFAADYGSNAKSGLLYLFELPPWLFILIGLLWLDLVSAWLIHFLQHKIKWMWKFHLVHHSDRYIDTTSANRHHPGESVLRFAFTLIAVVISGAPIWLVMIYQTSSALLSQFNHANINLSPTVDKLISLVIVSPNMHKVHHHYVQPYTDSNYANIFSIWDRLFGTFRTLDRDKIVYGIDTHMQVEEHNRLTNLLAMPFQPYRSNGDNKFASADDVT